MGLPIKREVPVWVPPPGGWPVPLAVPLPRPAPEPVEAPKETSA